MLYIRWGGIACANGQAKCICQRPCRRKSIFAFFCNGLLNNNIDCRRKSRIHLRQRWCWLLQVLSHNGKGRISYERKLTTEHLEDENAEAVDIGPLIKGFSPSHLRCHIFGSAKKHTCAGQGRV